MMSPTASGAASWRRNAPSALGWRQRQNIRQEIAARSGTYFAPELVAAFLKVSAREAFWLNLEPAALNGLGTLSAWRAGRQDALRSAGK